MSGRSLYLLGMQPEVIIIILICAAIGALILSRFSRSIGLLTYPVNLVGLLTGAILANLLMKRVRLPFEYAFDNYAMQRPLMISIGGMVLASFVMLLLMSRGKRNV